MSSSLYIVLQDLALGSEPGKPLPEEYHLGWIPAVAAGRAGSGRKRTREGRMGSSGELKACSVLLRRWVSRSRERSLLQVHFISRNQCRF